MHLSNEVHDGKGSAMHVVIWQRHEVLAAWELGWLRISFAETSLAG